MIVNSGYFHLLASAIKLQPMWYFSEGGCVLHFGRAKIRFHISSFQLEISEEWKYVWDLKPKKTELFRLQVFLKIVLHVINFLRKSKELPWTYNPSQMDVIFGSRVEIWRVELG